MKKSIKEQMEYTVVDEFNTNNFIHIYTPYCIFEGEEEPDWSMSLVNIFFDTYRDTVEFSLDLLKHPEYFIKYSNKFVDFTEEEIEKIKNIEQIIIFEELWSSNPDGTLSELLDCVYVGCVYTYLNTEEQVYEA